MFLKKNVCPLPFIIKTFPSGTQKETLKLGSHTCEVDAFLTSSNLQDWRRELHCTPALKLRPYMCELNLRYRGCQFCAS